MKIKVTVERTRTGYSAYAEDYAVYSVGKTMEQLRTRMVEALNVLMEKDHRLITESDIRMILDLPQFFEFYKVINAKALSERIGMNQSLLAQYIHGHKKPSSAQLKRILGGIRQIGKELAAVGIVE